MRKRSNFIVGVVLLLGIVAIGCSEKIEYRVGETSIIPKPQQEMVADGEFKLDEKSIIVIEDISLKHSAELLNARLKSALGEELTIEEKEPMFSNSIILSIEDNSDLGEEGYSLKINNSCVKIAASSAKGVYYGIESLLQLLPPEAVGKKQITYPQSLPLVSITDKPQYSWRALMLDESRHFKGESEVKSLLDQMAMLKMNIFHWHLTDDQGWRIEIKKYPKLTEIGSKRKSTQIGGWNSTEYTGEAHEGFYTQEQIKEIITYASDRNITIIPEIGMPGHASAAIASYPWTGTIGELTEVPCKFGKAADIYNVADPKVIEFLHNIIDEVVTLFPADYIHIGGDEVLFEAWVNNKSVSEYMKKMGYKTPTDLQVAFTNEIGKYINSKGKKMMGWNEIVGQVLHQEQGDFAEATEKLDTSTIVHFWKGNIDLMTSAIKEGYNVINSHHSSTYLDYSYEYISLEKAYNFSPIPEGLDENLHKSVMGFGTQMWSEWIPTVEKMELQIFPRLAAYAEVGWSNRDQKDYQQFLKRLPLFERRWDILDIKHTEIK